MFQGHNIQGGVKMSAAMLYAKKLLYTHKRLLIALFAIAGAAGILWQSCRFLFITQRYTLSIDAQCSETVRKDINAYADTTFKNIIFDTHAIAQLKSEFKYLKTIQARYVSPGYVEISCKAHAPLICINNDQVMLENGSIVKKTVFNDDVIKGLPSIVVAREDNIHSPLFAFHVQRWLADISNELFAQYTIRWVNHTNIHLEDKQAPKFSLITHSHKIPSNTCFAQYAAIKNYVLSQNKQKNNKDQKRWSVDVRFKNQFIVQTMHEGVA